MYMTCGSFTLPPDVVARVAAYLETIEVHQNITLFCVKPEVDDPVTALRAFFDRVVLHFLDYRFDAPPPSKDETTAEERAQWYRSRAVAPSKAVKTALDERAQWIQLLQGATGVDLMIMRDIVFRGKPSPVERLIRWSKVAKRSTKNVFVDVECARVDVDCRAGFAVHWGLHSFFYDLATSPQWSCEVMTTDVPTTINQDDGPWMHSIVIRRPHPLFQTAVEEVDIPSLLEGGVDFYEAALKKDAELGVAAKDAKKQQLPPKRDGQAKKTPAKRRKRA
jgi:hypothetical protein